MASIFKYKKQISLKKEFDDIYAALRKSKVEVGNHSYHCISVNNKFAFVPKADTFLAGNSAIPNVTAVVEETETDYKVDLEFSALPFVRIFSTIFAIFAAVIGIICIIPSLQSGTFNLGIVICGGLILFEYVFIRVGLILNSKRFISELLYELTGK